MGTIDQMIRDTMSWVKQGYQSLLIKTGLGIKEDEKIIKETRKRVAPDIQLWIDANKAPKIWAGRSIF